MSLKLFRGWFFVLLFLMTLSLSYVHAKERKQRMTAELKGKIAELEKLRDVALEEKTFLQLQVQSQSDPDWITITLKRVLGVSGEKQTKIHFDP